ncbi:MAG: hypothetical protein WBY88_04390, partial [Desulfosarcina sp.]
PWFEHARGFLERKPEWKTMEFYAQPCSDGTEIPVVFDNKDLIAKAEHHLQECDFKAAAVYTRSAFEKLIRKHCEKKKKALVFKSRLKDYTTEDFWKVIKNDLPRQTQNDIETYRPLVLNAFSHYNTELHEIRTELINAIQTIKNLKVDLAKI